MAITVKHKFVSAIPDAGDTSIVQPSNWNDDHQLTGTVPVANGGTGASTLTGYVKGNGTSAMTASATVPSTDITGLGTMSTQNSNNISVTGGSISGTTVAGYIPTTEKAAALGVATLDAGGTVPLSQIPASIQGGVSYQGTWNAATNTPTLSNGVGTKGYYYVVSVAGSTNLDGITSWNVGDWAIFNGTVWQKVDNTDAVTSVNGYTGTVVLTAADVSAVPYTGATGAVDLNNKSLTNVSNLGVGTAVVPTIKIRAIGDNNSSSRIAMRGYSSDANSSAIRVTKFRGTTSAPQAPQSGDSLGKFELAGYGTTSSEGYPQASLEGLATEAWGATARGTKAVIKVTPNTTTTQVTALTIDQNSAATFASSVTATSFSGSGSGLTSIPNSALTNSAITINGTSTSLGGSISVGTVTSVTGTSPVVSSGGATPAISMPAATTSVSGYLTSTDWNTFNNKGSGTVTSVSATSPVTSSGGATPTIAMPAATTSVSGYLTSTDWNTFNNKGSGTVTSVSGTTGNITSTGGATPVINLASGVATAGTTGSATLIPVVTIDTYGRVTGITTAANPQGTVTSVTGTAPVVSSGGATPAISMAAATGSVNGYLTSTDWTTFNGKQAALVSGTNIKTVNSTSLLGSGDVSVGVTSVTGTAPVVSSGGATPAISMAAATGSVNGYLTSTDWTTFNNKGSGTVTSTSVVSANGFAGTVATATTTPAITISTSITGVLKGNGTAISAATSGTDYSAGTSALGTGILKSTTTTGALTIAVAADFPTLNQNTTGSAGSVANALTAGTGLTATATYNGSAAITFNATGTTINSQTTGYTLVATDAGKTVSITTGGVTIPNAVMTAGNIVSIYNNSGSSQTITQGASLTLQWAGQSSSSTGNRTLGLYGLCTIVFISSSNAVITGSGLT